MADTNSIFYRIGQSVKSTISSELADYSPTTHNHNLSDLSDLDQNFLSGGVPSQDFSVLIWNSVSGKWQATSNFLGDKNLHELSDVSYSVTDPGGISDGQVLQWDSANGLFEPATIAGADYSNGIEVDQFVATPLLSLRSQDMVSSLASISAEESTQAGVGATVKIVAFDGTISIGDAGAAGGQSDLTVTGNTTIGGNLTVNGTATTVNTTNLDVEDQYIKLNKGGYGYFDGSVAGNSSAGIEIEVGPDGATMDGPKAQFLYNAGDTSSAVPLQDRGYFEALYIDPSSATPQPLAQPLQVKGLKVQATSATPQFDNLGNYEDFVAGLNA